MDRARLYGTDFAPLLGIGDTVRNALYGVSGVVQGMQANPRSDDFGVQFVYVDTLSTPLFLKQVSLVKRTRENTEAIEDKKLVSIGDLVEVTHERHSRFGDTALVEAIGSKGWSVGYTLSDINIANRIVQLQGAYASRFSELKGRRLENEALFRRYQMVRQTKAGGVQLDISILREDYKTMVIDQINKALELSRNITSLEELEKERTFMVGRHDFELIQSPNYVMPQNH
jgi:hypothetical protein